MDFLFGNMPLLETTTEITADTAETPAASTYGNFLGTMLPIFAILAFFYLVIMRPQKKKEKETQTMREALKIGDEICTIGGLVGIVVKKADDTVVIETGGDKTKLRIKTWAIQENITAKEAREAAIRKAKAEKQANLPVPVKTEKKENKKDAKKGEE